MTLFGLYLLFIKYGLLCFGGGYVLVPLLISDLVNARGMMAVDEFARLVSVSQATPGLIGINTATYVGYKLFGIAGGVIGTVGIVTPAMFLVLLAIALLKRYEKSVWVTGALLGIRPAAFGLIVVALVAFSELSVFTAKLPIDYICGLFTEAELEWNFGIRVVPLLIVVATVIIQKKSKISFLWLLLFSAIIGALFC